MIKRLKRRYLITNMALLSSTLVVCLSVLFGFLYHSEISASYSVMQEMMMQAEMPEHPQNEIPQMPTAMKELSGVQPLAADAAETEEIPAEYLYLDSGTAHMEPPPYWDFPLPNEDGGWEKPDDSKDWHDRGDFGNLRDYAHFDEDDFDDDNFDDEDDWEEQPREEFQSGTLPPRSESEVTHTTAATQENLESGSRVNRREPLQTTGESHIRPDESFLPSENDIPPSEGGMTTGTTPAGEPPQHADSDSRNEPPPTLVPVHEGQYIPDAFIAQIDEEGNISSYAGNDADTTEDEHFHTVHHAMDEVKKRGTSAGVLEIGDNSYRYLYQPDETGSYRLVLLDRTLELSTLSKLIFIFLLITVLGLLMMFGLSILIANWTVIPIATAWEKQKQFVADASHELKTPLAVISANTEVILANPQQSVAGQSKWLNYIQAETMRMSKLITNLLSVARMDSNEKLKEPLKPLSLSDTVSNVCLVFEPIIYENGKTLNTVIQRNVMLPAEEDNVKQLLSILLDNAVLHSVPHAQITVSLSKDTQEKIRLTVANTAKDIPQEQLVHLFDRFYRVDTEGSPNGSGLGLSIAKSIVHQMGGSLTVTSENQVVSFVAVFSP